MSQDRRQFLKAVAAITAAGVATSVTTGCASSSTPALNLPTAQGKSVMGLVVPKMDVVRIGFIGVGE